MLQKTKKSITKTNNTELNNYSAFEIYQNYFPIIDKHKMVDWINIHLVAEREISSSLTSFTTFARKGSSTRSGRGFTRNRETS